MATPNRLRRFIQTVKMKIEQVNFKDRSFLSAVKKYLVESQPYSGFSPLMSDPFLNKAVKQFIKDDLVECDYSSCFVSNNNEVLYYLFCKKDKENQRLEIIFAFPNTVLLNGTMFMSRWPFCFCHLLIDQLEKSGFKKVHGTIQRKNKENEYERALKRFGRDMFDIRLIQGEAFKTVSIVKENLIKAHGKLIKLYGNI